MTTIGVTMVRNEIDVIETTLRHMATQVDGLLVADNMSDDGTELLLRSLCRELPMSVVVDNEPAYYQSKKMTDLAHFARDMTGCEWIVPFDADEIWNAPLGWRISDFLDQVEQEAFAVKAILHDHVPSDLDDPTLPPIHAIRWRRKERVPLPKVAFRCQQEFEIEMGNHGVTYRDFDTTFAEVTLEVDHFPYRSPEQFVRKAIQGGKAYQAAADLPTFYGQHWRDYYQFFLDHGFEACAGIFREHFSVRDPRVCPDLEEHPALLAF